MQPVFITLFFDVCLKEKFDGFYNQVIFNLFGFGDPKFLEQFFGFIVRISIVLVYKLQNRIEWVMFNIKIGMCDLCAAYTAGAEANPPTPSKTPGFLPAITFFAIR